MPPAAQSYAVGPERSCEPRTNRQAHVFGERNRKPIGDQGGDPQRFRLRGTPALRTGADESERGVKRDRCHSDAPRHAPDWEVIVAIVAIVAIGRQRVVQEIIDKSRLQPGAERQSGNLVHSIGTMAHDDLVFSPSVSAGDRPACRLAPSPFHAQLSRRRGSARGARSGCLLRDGAAMGVELRAIVRLRTSPSMPAANDAMASR
jgi:hypothetical protein